MEFTKIIHKNNGLVAVAIFSINLLIFIAAPVGQIADSKYALLVSQSLLDHGTVRLDHYHLPKIESHGYQPHQLEIVNNHIFYYFPIGSSILSVPFVAVANLFGIYPINSEKSFGNKAILKFFGAHPVSADSDHSIEGETIIQRILAALLMAGLSVIFYFSSRLFLPIKWSILVVFSSTLGTSVLSTASRALWSHTWNIFLLGMTLYLIVKALENKKTIQPFLLATLLSWMYFVRPTSILSICAITVLLIVYFRESLAIFFTTAIVWVAFFAVYSLHFYDNWLPNYYSAGRLGSSTFWEALAGNIVSPSRGFLVYTPFAVWITFLLAMYSPYSKYKPLIVIGVVAIISHTIVISTFPHWWGGHSYGPRLMTDIIPWFTVLQIFSIKTMLTYHSGTQSKIGIRRMNKNFCPVKISFSIGIFMIILSVFLNMRGAFSRNTYIWNWHPIDVDSHPERLWSWEYPQFMAGIIKPPLLEKPSVNK